MPSSRPFAVIFLGFALMIGIGPTSARAGLALSVVDSTASPGGSGSFDVILANIGGTTSYQVSIFSVELSVAGSSGVNFLDAEVNTAAPYIFGTLQSPPLSFGPFPSQDFVASDSSMTSPFFTTLNVGDVYGLEHVTYSVAPGTALGPITVSIVGLGGNFPTTQIDDVNVNPLPFTANNGTINVAAPVPEPSSLVLTLTAMIAGPLVWLARRRTGRSLAV
jgi:hypothetical protein